MKKAYLNWSGGKDASLALFYIKHQGQYEIGCLLTSVNAVHNRVSMHGVRRELLYDQVRALGLKLVTIELPEEPGMIEYEDVLNAKVIALKQQGYTHSIFGDIFLEDLRLYREQQLSAHGIKSLFPLWKIPTLQLINTFLQLGFKAIVVCVNDRYLDKSFCGRLIDEQFIKDLPPNVDPCGENGEYHSFVFDGPIFNTPVSFLKGEIVYKEYKAPLKLDDDGRDSIGEGEKNYGFWFCDLLPA